MGIYRVVYIDGDAYTMVYAEKGIAKAIDTLSNARCRSARWTPRVYKSRPVVPQTCIVIQGLHPVLSGAWTFWNPLFHSSPPLPPTTHSPSLVPSYSTRRSPSPWAFGLRVSFSYPRSRVPSSLLHRDPRYVSAVRERVKSMGLPPHIHGPWRYLSAT
ncbi:hypothetical protein HYPSUDRAFT_34785 [Hypholoma sublateritium FD-334 SS-4]|uniref:Uncharacterized protein n=1 Tax=Hypholoma sublateritium (strain FD-334 SS-4) TaxID=945553 RepID=A0A0D2Q7G1_HYPSF|nr:hypothetical protein HYPSUDRAFT_34785 [Hypholoma sublateritium FD-334 SS-4]